MGKGGGSGAGAGKGAGRGRHFTLSFAANGLSNHWISKITESLMALRENISIKSNKTSNHSE
jgi:hypothetical protein